MNKIDFSIFEDSTRNALEKVEERLITPDSGLYVVFEKTQFELTGFPDEAFYTDKKDRYDPAPRPIEEYLSRNFEHFIWIPRWLVEGPEQRLIFRFAHECQHYRQSLDQFHKKRNQDFHDFLYQKGWRPNQLVVEKNWEEFDADREAYQTFVAVYGIDKWKEFVRSESENPKERDHFISLNSLLEKWSAYESKYLGAE